MTKGETMDLRAMMPSALLLLALMALPGTATGADAPPAVKNAEAPSAVKIGILTDESGIYAEAGGPGNVAAARLAIADAGGTVLSRPIELLDADHKNDPAVGTQILTGWFDDGVDAVAGLSTSSVALAAQQIARARDKTLLIAGAPDSDLIGKACAATSTHWAEDTYALARSTAEAVVPSGGDSWFFVTVDHAFGLAMERDANEAARALGALVLGRVRHPLVAADFSAVINAAKASHAKIVALADAGADLEHMIQQAGAAHLDAGGQTLAGLLVYLTDIHAVGLAAAQRLYVTEGFYWDQNDAARAFAKRFETEMHRMPTKQQAATYASVRHYLAAVAAAGTTEARAVNAEMRTLPIDFFGRPATIRPDGQVAYDLTLYQVKSPAESQYPWDYLKKVRDIPAARAFRPVAEGGCPLVK